MLTSKTPLLVENASLQSKSLHQGLSQLGLYCELPSRLESLSGMLKIWLREPDGPEMGSARQQCLQE